MRWPASILSCPQSHQEVREQLIKDLNDMLLLNSLSLFSFFLCPQLSFRALLDALRLCVFPSWAIWTFQRTQHFFPKEFRPQSKQWQENKSYSISWIFSFPPHQKVILSRSHERGYFNLVSKCFLSFWKRLLIFSGSWGNIGDENHNLFFLWD